jgi:hypothetical protein
MDPPSAAAMLAASVAAAEKSPDDPSVLEKARSTAFHSLATLRAALRAGMRAILFKARLSREMNVLATRLLTPSCFLTFTIDITHSQLY